MPWITIVSFLKPSWNDAVSTTLSTIKSPSKTSELNNCNTSNPWRWQQWEIDEKNWTKNEYSNFKTPDVDINFSFLQSGLRSFPLFVIKTFELYMSFNLFWINIMGMVLLPHPPLFGLLPSLSSPDSCWELLRCAGTLTPALCSASSPCTSVTWCSWPDLSLHLRQNIVVISYKFSYHSSNLIILNYQSISCNWSHFAESPWKLLILKNLPSKPLTGLKSSTMWFVWHNFSWGTTFLFYNFFIFWIKFREFCIFWHLGGKSPLG